MFGQIAGTATEGGMVAKVLELVTLVLHFIYLVARLAEGVEKATGLQHLGIYQKAFLLLVNPALHQIAQRVVARCDDLLHLVDDTVDGRNVAVADGNGHIAIDVDAVGVVL